MRPQDKSTQAAGLMMLTVAVVFGAVIGFVAGQAIGAMGEGYLSSGGYLIAGKSIGSSSSTDPVDGYLIYDRKTGEVGPPADTTAPVVTAFNYQCLGNTSGRGTFTSDEAGYCRYRTAATTKTTQPTAWSSWSTWVAMPIGSSFRNTSTPNSYTKKHVQFEWKDEAENLTTAQWDYYASGFSGECP